MHGLLVVDYIVKADIATTFIVMAWIVMADIGMAYVATYHPLATPASLQAEPAEIVSTVPVSACRPQPSCPSP